MCSAIGVTPIRRPSTKTVALGDDVTLKVTVRRFAGAGAAGAAGGEGAALARSLRNHHAPPARPPASSSASAHDAARPNAAWLAAGPATASANSSMVGNLFIGAFDLARASAVARYGGAAGRRGAGGGGGAA